MKSKRLMIAVAMLILNFIIFGVGMYLNKDLTALGTGLALINAPLYGYLFSETTRPSGMAKKSQEKSEI